MDGKKASWQMKTYSEISRTHYYGEACWNLTWYYFFPTLAWWRHSRCDRASTVVERAGEEDSSNWVNYTYMTECVARCSSAVLSFMMFGECLRVQMFISVFHFMASPCLPLMFALCVDATGNYEGMLGMWMRWRNDIWCSSVFCWVASWTCLMRN